MTSDSQPSNETLFQLSAGDLRAAMVSGRWNASDVTEIYLRRGTAINPALNAMVVSLAEHARERARALDQQRAANEPCGPLHGVPISIKECFDYEGTPTTGGFPQRRDHRARETAPLVKALEAAGAVVLGKTNVPEMLIYLESDNPLYGCTKHPWRADRTPGGSSGGEAALVAAGGSALGLGTDLGGSIRLPAHYCGIHGFKPTSHCLSVHGTIDELLAPGQEVVIDQPGPLGRHVDDLILMMQVLTAPEARVHRDASVPPVPFEVPRIVPGQLRLGMYVDDGFFPTSRAVRRIVEDAARALGASGVEVVPFQPPQIDHAMSIYFSLLAADGGQWARPWLQGRGHDHRLAAMARLARMPSPARRMLAWGLERIGQRYSAASVRRFGRVDVNEYWQCVEQHRLYVRHFIEQMDAAGIDGVICPPAATPAMTHGASYYLTGIASATMLYNLLGFPAGTVAAGRVRADESGLRPPKRDWVERAAAQVDADSAGLPLGVQVVGRPWQDGWVLAVMKMLEMHFSAQETYPVWSGDAHEG